LSPKIKSFIRYEMSRMPTTRREFLKQMGLGGAAITSLSTGGSALAWKLPKAAAQSAINPTLHLLNRITYGARPEDLERAKSIGVEAFLEEQLNPELLDDSEAEARLAELPILAMNRREASRLVSREYRCYVALTKGAVVRMVYSKRQLLERMTEFWTDHFNVPGSDFGPELVTFHRELRAKALGKFRDLLFKSAQAPAMLHYLDNYQNVAEHPNENYARELMELHTLSVDGGYGEADVKAVARAFTGWTVHDGTETGFYFDPSVHDRAKKVILGHHLPGNRGIEDGLHVLSLLADHPSTARFVCRKLCVRFVSDTPSDGLVESTAAVWMANDGEIKPVLRHIFGSDEFQAAVGQKLRRPLEFFIAALRVTGTEVHQFNILENMLSDLAQIPFGWHPPDGYPDTAKAWMSSAGLLGRWNTAMQLTHGVDSEYDQQNVMTGDLFGRMGAVSTVGELVDAVAYQVFAARLPDDMRQTFVAYAADDGDANTPVTSHLIARKLGSLYGMMLASPLFQWR
jgi:uncharacterized protein (DUF1800 family)